MRARRRAASGGAPAPALRGADARPRPALRRRLADAGRQGGARPRTAGEPCWHELVRRGAADACPAPQPFELEAARGLPGEGLRFVCGAWHARPPPAGRRLPRPTAAPAGLAGANGAGRARAAARRWRRREPSAPDRRARRPADEARLRFRRGLLVHRLLQLLPDLAAERAAGGGGAAAHGRRARPAAGPARRARRAASWRCSTRPEFAAVFGPGSRAEQPICGTIGGRPIVGQIDRLVVTPDEVLVVDLQEQPPAAGRCRARRPSATCASSPPTVPCWRSSIRAAGSGRACSGPRCPGWTRFRRRCSTAMRRTRLDVAGWRNLLSHPR